jgi:Na+/H+-dicarboxylate symporter
MPRPAAFLGGALTAIGIFGVIISIVQLTDKYWWLLFYLAIGIIGGFSLGSVSASFKEQEKNAYLTLTGFMLAALILLTVFLGIWQNSNPALNTDLGGIWVIIIAAASGLITFIGTTLMSVGEGFKR